eukprot:09995.XXX_273815_276540_1 [CDS] Oithona nana genome sequencing.
MEDINEDQVVCLDVGGDRHFIKRGFLIRFPSTRLGRVARATTTKAAMEHCSIFYDKAVPEYFFDRNPENFSSILDIYRTNMFHLTSTGCALVLQKDLEYWGIDELMMEPCCALKYYPEIETCVNEKTGDLKEREREKELAEEENFGDHTVAQIRSWLWNVMEYPWTSKTAQINAFVSLGMVIVSTLTFILSTLEDFKEEEEIDPNSTFNLTLEYIDTAVIVFFTLEYAIRFACAPRKWKFFKDAMNLVDILAIIPFYLALILNQLEDIQVIGKAGKMIRLIRVMRILRIFKLVRHFAGLQSLLFTLRQAYRELGLLMLLVFVAILTFSSLVYFAEKEGYDDGSLTVNNWTFVESFWWGLMTITTVGYDLDPKTFLGKLIGGFTALSGTFILTLPIPIVVNSFAGYYKNRLWRNEVAQKKRERAMAQAAEAREMQKAMLFRAMAGPLAAREGVSTFGAQK